MFVIFICLLHFPIRQFFCKSHRYSRHGKMLRCSELIIVNFTLLSDIDITKPKSKSGAAYVIFILNFSSGLSLVLSLVNQVDFLVVCDDRTTANFEH